MSFGNPKADALHAELMEHARQCNWPLPEPEHGEEWGAYVHRLDQVQRLVLYDRDVMKDLRHYRRLVAHAEELGVPLMERSADLDAPTSKADALALLADPVRRAERAAIYEPENVEDFRSSLTRKVTGHVDPD